MARFWAKFIDNTCLPAIWKIRRRQGKEHEQAIDEAIELLKTLESELKDKKFFGGENIGMVDIVANFIGIWLGIFEEMMGVTLLTKEKLPRLSEWVDDYLNCSIIKENFPNRERLLQIFKALYQPKCA